MSNLAHNTSNSAALEMDRKATFAYARELGRDKAYGDDSLPKLGLRACEDAQKGILTPDDAKALYEDYITSCSKKSEHTEGGKAGNSSKLANFIKLGVMTTVDGVQTLQTAVFEHSKMRDAKLQVKSAYLAYETVAKHQLAAPHTPLTTEEIRTLCAKDEMDKTAKDHIKAATKALEKALAMPQDLNEAERLNAETAFAAASAALNLMETREAKAEKLAQLAALQQELGLAA
jgi:hypothetical protein